jgi:hypothetical protein
MTIGCLYAFLFALAQTTTVNLYGR